MSLIDTKRAFRDAILAISNCPGNASDVEIDALNMQLQDPFLLFGSQTDDNVSCAENVQVGIVNDGTSTGCSTVGLRMTSDHR